MDVSESEPQHFVLKYDNLSDFADLLCAAVDLVKKGHFEEEKDIINSLSVFEKLDTILCNIKVHLEPTVSVPLCDEAFVKAALKYVKFCRSVADPNKESLFCYDLCDTIVDVVYRFVF